jgi:hypothetical protein
MRRPRLHSAFILTAAAILFAAFVPARPAFTAVRVGAPTVGTIHAGAPVRAAKPCDKLSASQPASWFGTDADGNVDTTQTVDNYAAGSIVIAPGFTYPCAPADAEVVVIVYNQAYGSDPALIDKRTIQAGETEDTFFYGITTPDGSPLQEGQWRAAFYQDKTPLTTGDIIVGGNASVDVATQVVLQGAVTDGRTGQPVWQARIFVLNPGITVDQFRRDPQRDQIFAQTRTDAQGEFALWKPIERNTAYAMLIAADGYKLKGTDRLYVGDQAPSPVTLSIKLVKR